MTLLAGSSQDNANFDDYANEHFAPPAYVEPPPESPDDQGIMNNITHTLANNDYTSILGRTAAGIGITAAEAETSAAQFGEHFEQQNLSGIDQFIDDNLGTHLKQNNQQQIADLEARYEGMQAAQKAITPDPRTMTAAQKTIQTVGAIATYGAVGVLTGGAGVSFLGASQGAQETRQLAEQGVPMAPAVGLGAKTAALYGAMPSVSSMLPIGPIGRFLAAGPEMLAIDVGNKQSSAAVLDHYGFHDMADQYRQMDTDSVIADLAMGWGGNLGHEAANYMSKAFGRGGASAEAPAGVELPPRSPEQQLQLTSSVAHSDPFLAQAHAAVEGATPMPGFDPQRTTINPFDEAINRIRDGAEAEPRGQVYNIRKPDGSFLNSNEKMVDQEHLDTPAGDGGGGAAAQDDFQAETDANAQKNFISQLQDSVQKFITQRGIDLKKATNFDVMDALDKELSPEEHSRGAIYREMNESIMPSHIDAAMMIKDGQGFEQASPGVPTDTESRGAHFDAMNKAASDVLTNDRSADVDGILDGSNFIERTQEEAELQKMAAQMRDNGTYDAFKELASRPDHEVSAEEKENINAMIKSIERLAPEAAPEKPLDHPGQISERSGKGYVEEKVSKSLDKSSSKELNAESNSPAKSNDVGPSPDGKMQTPDEAAARQEKIDQKTKQDKDIIDALAECAIDNAGIF